MGTCICSKPCCVALGGVQRPSSVYNWYTEEGGPYTCPTCESILRARDGDNPLIQYGILLSVMEAKLEDLVFCTHYGCSMY